MEPLYGDLDGKQMLGTRPGGKGKVDAGPVPLSQQAKTKYNVLDNTPVHLTGLRYGPVTWFIWGEGWANVWQQLL